MESRGTKPKSPILYSFLVEMKMLDGFRSIYILPAFRQALRAAHRSMPRFTASRWLTVCRCIYRSRESRKPLSRYSW